MACPRFLVSLDAYITPPGCHDRGRRDGSVRLVVFKRARTGSTWLRKELQSVPGVQLEFEPFTDGRPAQHCPPAFFTAALTMATHRRLRCVAARDRERSCYWRRHCNASLLPPWRGRERPLVAGVVLNPAYAPGADWGAIARGATIGGPPLRTVWLCRTNLIKMAMSDLRRLAKRRLRAATASGPPLDSPAASSSLDSSSLLNGTVAPAALLAKAAEALSRQTVLHGPWASLGAGGRPSGMVLLYEDLQRQRLLALRSVLTYLGDTAHTEAQSAATC